ncbi:hypothetical protein pEaSNUABM29_00036 [Erwinia phage pEa_SNUABM_29]|nr:hypothetical protein pEaSNUABM29_00036 [Erwinia phage pEa_SNUABM_29]
MKLIAEIKHIPASVVANASGVILKLPRSDFADQNDPSKAFTTFLRRNPCYTEYGNPEFSKTQACFEEAIIHRMRTIDHMLVGGYLCNARVSVSPEFVEVTADFSPSGPYRDAVVDLMQSSGQVCLGARFIKDAFGKIVDVPSWDVVVELEEPTIKLA